MKQQVNYRPRPGIVKTKLCGMQVLIPCREASSWCTSIQRLPLIWSVAWESFSQGVTVEKFIPIYAAFTKKPPEECRENVELFCRTMVERGFMIEVLEEPEG